MRNRSKIPSLSHHAQHFVENTAESTAACLLAMVQGNLLALGLSHWIVASQTGLLAGAFTSVAILATRMRRPWIVSTTLGLVTMGVDFFVHPGMIGPIFVEAVLTGTGAAGLSGLVYALFRRRRTSTARPGESSSRAE